MMVQSALALLDDDVDNKFTIASCKTLCMPKNKNMAKDRRIICCVGGRVSRKAEPKPASDLVDDFLDDSVVADGASSAASVLLLMRGCLITISSFSDGDDEPSSISRSSSIRGDIILHIDCKLWHGGMTNKVRLLERPGWLRRLHPLSVKGPGIDPGTELTKMAIVTDSSIHYSDNGIFYSPFLAFFVTGIMPASVAVMTP
jgi:hypothetical protein